MACDGHENARTALNPLTSARAEMGADLPCFSMRSDAVSV